MTLLLKVDEIDISRVSVSELQDAIGEWSKVLYVLVDLGTADLAPLFHNSNWNELTWPFS